MRLPPALAPVSRYRVIESIRGVRHSNSLHQKVIRYANDLPHSVAQGVHERMSIECCKGAQMVGGMPCQAGPHALVGGIGFRGGADTFVAVQLGSGFPII